MYIYIFISSYGCITELCHHHPLLLLLPYMTDHPTHYSMCSLCVPSVCRHMWVNMAVEDRSLRYCSPGTISTMMFLRQSLSQARKLLLGWADWPGSPRGLLASASLALGLQVCSTMPFFCFWELEFRFSCLQGEHFTSWTTLPVPFLAIFNQTPLQSARVLWMLSSSCSWATTERPLSHLPGSCHCCCPSTGLSNKAPCTWLASSSFPASVILCPVSIPFHHRCSSRYTWALTFHPGLCFSCVFSLTTHQLIHSCGGVSLPPPLVLISLTQRSQHPSYGPPPPHISAGV